MNYKEKYSHEKKLYNQYKSKLHKEALIKQGVRTYFQEELLNNGRGRSNGFSGEIPPQNVSSSRNLEFKTISSIIVKIKKLENKIETLSKTKSDFLEDKKNYKIKIEELEREIIILLNKVQGSGQKNEIREKILEIRKNRIIIENELTKTNSKIDEIDEMLIRVEILLENRRKGLEKIRRDLK